MQHLSLSFFSKVSSSERFSLYFDYSFSLILLLKINDYYPSDYKIEFEDDEGIFLWHILSDTTKYDLLLSPIEDFYFKISLLYYFLMFIYYYLKAKYGFSEASYLLIIF